MNFEKYCREAKPFCQESCWDLDYLRMGLISEAGEVAGMVKRTIRGDMEVTDGFKMELIRELGDVAWYVAMLCLKNEEGNYWPDCEFIADEAEHVGREEPCLEEMSMDLFCLIDEAGSIPDTYNIRLIEAMLEMFYDFIDFFALDTSISDIYLTNIVKLEDRKLRGVIAGSGGAR